MTKEEALNEFLYGLRIILNNASAYPKEHPYFLQSVDVFRKKLVNLLSFLNPLRIDVAVKSLFIDGRYWEKAMLYEDLASLFHLRKIKSIELMIGVNNQELIEFLSSVSMPVKEVLRHGGVQAILNKEKTPHIQVEELDYSQLLRDEGGEVKDIWVFLFKEVIEKEDQTKINAFVQNFEQIVRKFNSKDLYEDMEFRENLYNFLSYLKANDKAKFSNCSKNLLGMLLGNPSLPAQERLEEIRVFFQDLTNDDLVNTLVDSISQSENFNNLSFQVFATLFDQARHKKIAPEIVKKINPRFRKRIKEIFSLSPDSYVFPIYRQAMEGLWQEEAAGRQWDFDLRHLQVNYGFLLVNLLAQEEDPQALELMCERLLKDCAGLVKERNWGFMWNVSELLNEKLRRHPRLTGGLKKLQESFYYSIEAMAFEEEVPQELEYFLKDVSISSFGIDFYLKNIFEERRVNPFILRLLLKIFPHELDVFYENLERVKSDMEFLAKMLRSFQGQDSPLSLEILKKIYDFSNNIIRLEVLKTMQSIPQFDKEFLLPLLKKGDFSFKKQAFLILARDDEARQEALDELFSTSSPFGFKNKILLENMMMLEDVKGQGLKEARTHLVLLSKRPFFWNKNVREKAAQVMRILDAEED
ncbi:MAG: hypothetical protein AMJ95_08350 [Omnitrophica WOR_2 bacterium SM23_72]|nr:MAG: hypothetical protein AMJ95_08350 [Omnitrophica WOR_2 bacterium SM23_72]